MKPDANQTELPPRPERLMPACGVDSTMRVIPHMVDIEDGYYIRYADYAALEAENESLKAFIRDGCDPEANPINGEYARLYAQWEETKAERDKALALVQEYRTNVLDTNHAFCLDDDRCPTCIKADALLNKPEDGFRG